MHATRRQVLKGLVSVAAAGIGHSAAAAVTPGRIGVQAIGIARWRDKDVEILAGIAQKAASHVVVEVAFLPFTFDRNDPFGKLDTLIQSEITTRPGQVWLTTHLTFHDPKEDPQPDWDLFLPNKASDDQRLRHLNNIGYLHRLDQYADWLRRSTQWLQLKGSRSQVVHTLVPMLEDNAPSSAAYRNYFENIDAALKSSFVRHGMKWADYDVRYRRSAASRVGSLALERHAASVPSTLSAGDAWSNDGATITASQFVSQRQAKVKNGITCLYWCAAFNGNRNEDPQKRKLQPFADTDVQKDIKRVFGVAV